MLPFFKIQAIILFYDVNTVTHQCEAASAPDVNI